MKNVALMALIAIFTLSFGLTAQNDTQNRRENRQDNRTERGLTAKERAETMAKQLKLTTAEKAKVEALLVKQDAKRAEQVAQQRGNREESTQDRAKRREEMQAMREKTVAANDAELEVIIGKKKMEQWKKYRAEQQRELRNTDRPRRNTPPGNS